jgi:hypothetical protein
LSFSPSSPSRESRIGQGVSVAQPSLTRGETGASGPNVITNTTPQNFLQGPSGGWIVIAVLEKSLYFQGRGPIVRKNREQRFVAEV